MRGKMKTVKEYAFTDLDTIVMPFWKWVCRDCHKEYPEDYKFTTEPKKCDCGGVVDFVPLVAV